MQRSLNKRVKGEPPWEDQPREEPGDAIPPESADELDQDGPRGHGGKTLLEHARDAMNENAELGSLPAE